MTAPLHGIRVLDFSPLLPGPFASRILADLGADVVRIEAPSRADMARQLPPFVNGVSAIHAYLNRNKRSVALDLKREDDLAVARQLAERSDVVLEQFRPGVMERFGLDFRSLSEVNSRLVYCSITGYGQSGPMRDRAGHDINYVALSGLIAACGRAEAGPPPLAFQAGDVAGGSLHAVIGILAALRQRDLDGKGQHVDVSMTDCAFHLNPLAAAASLAGAPDLLPEGGVLNGATQYDYYRTADDRWLAVGSLEPPFIAALAQVLGEPGLGELLRCDMGAAKQCMSAHFARRNLAAWQERFAKVDACVEPVLNLPEAMSSELAGARRWVVDVPLPAGGSIAQPTLPIKFSRFTPTYGLAGGVMGADQEEVLGRIKED